MEKDKQIETVELLLDKSDLVSLVMGTTPSYIAMGNPVGHYGTFSASYSTWYWNKYKLEKLSIVELLEIYKICKQSWNDNELSQYPRIPKETDKDVQIRLLQYENLRNHFQELINEVLGPDYYNEGMDVYTADEFVCRDLKDKLKKKRWW